MNSWISYFVFIDHWTELAFVEDTVLIFVWLKIAFVRLAAEWNTGKTYHFYCCSCLCIIQFCCITHFKGINVIVPENILFISILLTRSTTYLLRSIALNALSTPWSLLISSVTSSFDKTRSPSLQLKRENCFGFLATRSFNLLVSK